MFWQELGKSLAEQFFGPSRLLSYARSFINVLIIVTGAWFATKLFNLVVNRIFRQKEERYFRTVVPLVQSLFRYLILALAIVLILRAVGVDYKAIIAGAGVVGLAIGFGAQTLVKDFISGFFTLFEGAIAAGDYIVTSNLEGTVEKIGLRVTQIRAFDGTLWTVPNGELTSFGNRNRDYMRAIVGFDLAYEQNAEQGMKVAEFGAKTWYARNRERCLDIPEVQGLLNFGDSGMRIRVVCKVKPGEQWAAERELRLEIKKALDEAGIEIPFPRRVVYNRQNRERIGLSGSD
ncbi:MAG: mechanosensitive ion channel family protein [candidate division WOR-3 bacterium]|uniref:Mechanosensitive ion channel n=2 Tax=candidate division WOR-3 bacterium TaxID=2052148 RepID=A0A7C1SRY3_UNCW3|nr:mechanosensitive ion channel family protein [candidate division WOR-3 bacterium]